MAKKLERRRMCKCCGMMYVAKRARGVTCSRSCSSKLAWEVRDRKLPTLGVKPKHGMSGTPTYSSWASMKSRCLLESDQAFARYGGAGITVCDRWLGKSGFENFLRDMGERPDGKSIDRVDTRGGYSPENCRWATPREQCQNRTHNNTITAFGETLCVAEWARRSNIPEDTLRVRLFRLGWTPELAISKSVSKRAPRHKSGNRTQWRPE
jgi:hypothetical protein